MVDNYGGGPDGGAQPLSRRTYLKLTASAAVVSGTATQPAAAGTTDRYGYGGYGADGYGTASGLAVSTGDATSVGETSGTLNGSLGDLGGASSADVYFEYRETGVTGWTTTSPQTLSATGGFSQPISGLDDGVEQEFRASAAASDGDTDTGTDAVFTTTEHSVAVSTDQPTAVGETAATLAGSLTDLGNATSADVYFEYRPAGASTWTATAVQTLSATGSFDASVSGLADGESYEYRAVTAASDGDTDTDTLVSFSTTEHSVAVSTDTATDVGETTATLNGSVTDLGNATSADVYFEYRETGVTGWTTTTVQSLSGGGSFSESLSALSSGTEYEYRATADASDGDSNTGSLVTYATASAESAPTIDRFSVSESGSPNPHAEISVDWAGSDVDGDLSLVTVTVTDTSGQTVRSSETSVSGASASGSESYKIKHRGGQDYDVSLSVQDATGATTTQQTTVSS